MSNSSSFSLSSNSFLIFCIQGSINIFVNLNLSSNIVCIDLNNIFALSRSLKSISKSYNFKLILDLFILKLNWGEGTKAFPQYLLFLLL